MTELSAIGRGERVTSFGACRSKLRFETERDAEKSAAKLRKRDAERKTNQSVRVYRCNVCGAWHLTSRRLRDGEVAT